MELSNRVKGSYNHTKARFKNPQHHVKSADCRTNALHQATRKLSNENQVVCVESLKVKNMIRTPPPSIAIADAHWRCSPWRACKPKAA
ncbi:hypothetical protein ACXEIS_004857 [Klebsiella variicola]